MNLGSINGYKQVKNWRQIHNFQKIIYTYHYLLESVVNHCYIRQPYEQTFRELQWLTEAGSFGLNINYYSNMFAEWGWPAQAELWRRGALVIKCEALFSKRSKGKKTKKFIVKLLDKNLHHYQQELNSVLIRC